MFERFSRPARAAVVAAVEEAQRRGDGRVGTEHLLLGLLNDPGSPAARALGRDLDAARAALRRMDLDALAAVGLDVDGDIALAAPAPRQRGHRPFTAAARAALTATLAIARRRQARRIEPEDLLIALLDSGPQDTVHQVLDRLSVEPAVVRSRLSGAA